jgi:hypothetical protein
VPPSLSPSPLPPLELPPTLELSPLELPPLEPLALALVELIPPPDELLAEDPADRLVVDLPPIPPPNVELCRQLGQAIVPPETGLVETDWKQPAAAKRTTRAESVRLLTNWSIARKPGTGNLRAPLSDEVRPSAPQGISTRKNERAFPAT